MSLAKVSAFSIYDGVVVAQVCSQSQEQSFSPLCAALRERETDAMCVYMCTQRLSTEMHIYVYIDMCLL